MSSEELLDLEEERGENTYRVLSGNVLDFSTYKETTKPGSVQALITTINPWGDSTGGVQSAIRSKTGDIFFSPLESEIRHQQGDAIHSKPEQSTTPFGSIIWAIDDVREGRDISMKDILRKSFELVKEKQLVRVAITPIRCSSQMANILGKEPGESERELVKAVKELNDELEVGTDFPVDIYFVTNDPKTKENLEIALHSLV